MSQKTTILVQLDIDSRPSVFDRVVAVDAGVQELFSYGGITPENVVPLVHGCIFTRGPKDLHRTAIFVGGSDVETSEAVWKAVKAQLLPDFGLTVSTLFDPNGANTTAAAAVALAAKYLDLARTKSLVLGGTGPVGSRVARLLARQGGHVAIGSRQKDRAEAVAANIRQQVPGAAVEAVTVASTADAPVALAGREFVVAAGAPGTVLLPKKVRQAAPQLRVAIDLNGVPPAGIEGIQLTDQGIEREGVISFGAIGVGGTKMKLHKLAIQQLFSNNQTHYDLEELFRLIPQI